MSSTGISRRRVLQIAGGAAAAGILPPIVGEASPPNDGKDGILDVAIVGGGVSGLYAAWRLQAESRRSDGQPPFVTVFEGSRRVGGRLLSVMAPGIPGTRIELGGMRFASIHKRLAALVDYLGLIRDEFPVSEPQNIAYVRGKMLRAQDLLNADVLPYNLAPDERSASTLGEGFTALAARRVLRAMFDKDLPLDQVDWGKVASTGLYEGKSLSDLPLQFVVQRNISEEAFRFGVDTSGYDSILHTWNAADGLPWNLAEFGQEVSFFRLRDGLEALPATIAARFQQDGGRVLVEQRLKGFDKTVLPDGSVGIELRIISGDGHPQIVRSRKLVLAMPRRSLELLDQAGAVLGSENPRVHELIRSVEPIPLFKLALCYPHAWWETLDPVLVRSSDGTTKLANITRGRSVTDLPLRQCYYWAKDATSQKAVVLIYDDGMDHDFWAGLRDNPSNGTFDPDNAGRASESVPESWSEYQAPRLMVDEAHRQMLVMHGVRDRTDIPPPYAAAYRDWGEDPFGGGANFWRVNAKSNDVFWEILQPKRRCQSISVVKPIRIIRDGRRVPWQPPTRCWNCTSGCRLPGG